MAPSLVVGSAEETSAPEPQKTKTITPNQTLDPSVYELEHKTFTTEGIPSTAEGWLKRARQVAEILAKDATARDIDNKTPVAEVSLLKSAGLLKVLGPAEYGGGGQSWEVGYKVIREVSKGDGSIGMLCKSHYDFAILNMYG